MKEHLKKHWKKYLGAATVGSALYGYKLHKDNNDPAAKLSRLSNKLINQGNEYYTSGKEGLEDAAKALKKFNDGENKIAERSFSEKLKDQADNLLDKTLDAGRVGKQFINKTITAVDNKAHELENEYYNKVKDKVNALKDAAKK